LEKEHLIGVVNRARQGDESAKEALYLDTYKSTYRFALRMVRNTEDAEDITQEVFITVCNKIAELREPAAFYKWVNQITVNKCNELFRKYKGIAFLDDEDAIMTMVDDDPMNLPDKAIDDEATRQIIMDVIENLPDGQRSCVLYYYYSQLTIAQIADILEISEGTVKSRLSTARAKIRAALEEKEKKEGIKLYGIPLALTPILQQSIDQIFVPDELAARMWENIKRTLYSNMPSNSASESTASTTPEGALDGAPESMSGGNSNNVAINATNSVPDSTLSNISDSASCMNAPSTGASGSVSSVTATTAATVSKVGIVLSTKAIVTIVGGVVLAAAVTATAVFWPQISGVFSRKDAPAIVERLSRVEVTDKRDDINNDTIADDTQAVDEAADIEGTQTIAAAQVITLDSWVDQATGYTYTFFGDNTIAVITSDGALMESGTYLIEDGQMRLSLSGGETLSCDFDNQNEKLTIAYRDGPVNLSRTPRVDVPSVEGHGDINDFEGIWAEASGDEYTFSNDNTVTVIVGGHTESGKYEIYANSVSLTFDGDVRVMRFELDNDELTLTFQGQQTQLSRVIPSAIPPGRYYSNNRMDLLGTFYIPFIDINSDGTFRRLNLSYANWTWAAHWSEATVANSYDEHYWEGTYVVIDDMLIFTPLTVLYPDNSSGGTPTFDSFGVDDQFTLMFDGINLVGKSWTERDGVELFNGTNEDTMYGYPADAIFIRVEDTSIPVPVVTPPSAPLTEPIKTNDEIWIRISRVSNSGSNTTLIFDLIEPMSFSMAEFEQLKGGASINKYGQSFTVRQLNNSEREYYYGYMDYVVTTIYYRGHFNEPYNAEYSYIEEEGKIVLINDADYMASYALGTVQRDLTVTLTSETVVNLFVKKYYEILGQYDLDASGTYPFEPSILENPETWYTSFNEFHVTVRNGVWVDMRQVFYSQ